MLRFSNALFSTSQILNKTNPEPWDFGLVLNKYLGELGICSEMNESNGKLGEKDNWLSDRIKANIEVPSKEYCRIM